MNRINKKILEDIDVLSKAMEKNNLCEVKFSDDIVSYELKKQPKKLCIIGSGAIGIEFAYFYNSMGTDVTLIEFQDRIAPNEDHEISKESKKDRVLKLDRFYLSLKQ